MVKAYVIGSLVWVSAIGAALGMAACSSATPAGAAPTDGGIDGALATPTGPIDVQVPCADSDDAIYADPGTLPATQGTILKCSYYKTIAKADLESELRGLKDSTPQGYQGKPFTSGAKLYKILYRTQRGTNPPTPGYAVATLFLPDTPIAPKVPIVVANHGSRGQASMCAPSRFDPAADAVKGDFESLVYTYVGLGFAVIAPDNGGYSNFGAAGNPVPTYSNAADIAFSVIDATYALQKVIPSRLLNQTVLTGHSQGGLSTLASLAISTTYPPAAPITAVATFAPLWFSQRSWGAIFVEANQFKLGESAAVPASIWYHYTTSELLDGPGTGLNVFSDKAKAAVTQFMNTECWGPTYPALSQVGVLATDFFDPTFVQAVESPAALGAACPAPGSPGADVCAKWLARYSADRPLISGAASKVPLLVAAGGVDTTIPRDRMRCALDTLQSESTALSYCYDPAADHGGILRSQGDYVVEWVANQTLGQPITKTCPSNTILTEGDGGVQLQCPSVPPNK